MTQFDFLVFNANLLEVSQALSFSILLFTVTYDVFRFFMLKHNYKVEYFITCKQTRRE